MNTQEIYCPNCGTVNPITAKFCGNCGQDLTDAIAEVKAAADPQKQAYQQATADLAGGHLAAAVQGFRSLGGYADSPAQLEKAMARLSAQEAAHRTATYQKASVLFGQGELAQAAALFSQISGFQDADEKLALVQKAQAQQAAEQQAQAAQAQAQQNQQAYDQNYRDALQKASQATTTGTLKPYIDYLEQYRDYQDGAAQLNALKQRLAEMAAAEQVNGAKRKRQGMIVGIILAVLVVVIGGGWFAYNQHQNAQADLQKQVAAQRTTNAKSFDQLDSKTKKNIKTMAATYHANVHDYTYKVKGETDDYQLIGFAFHGPDKTKDVMSATGTRLYGSVALYRQ